MAAGSAGDPGAGVPLFEDPNEVPNMRTAMNAQLQDLSGQVSRLQIQMAGLMGNGESDDEHPPHADAGRAVRSRVYDHAQDSDRIRMDGFESSIQKLSTSIEEDRLRISEWEASLGGAANHLNEDIER